jgi:hypothetical protein
MAQCAREQSRSAYNIAHVTNDLAQRDRWLTEAIRWDSIMAALTSGDPIGRR